MGRARVTSTHTALFLKTIPQFPKNTPYSQANLPVSYGNHWDYRENNTSVAKEPRKGDIMSDYIPAVTNTGRAVKSKLFLLVLGLLQLIILSSCCSTGLKQKAGPQVKTLMPGAIANNINGLPNLPDCQFYISKDVTLHYESDKRQNEINESGIVEVQRIIQRNSIKITSSTPGILQTQKDGESVSGYTIWNSYNHQPIITLYILFENNNNNVLCFSAWYNVKTDRFELVNKTAVYNGLNYTIAFSGEELPYLTYRLLEKTVEDSNTKIAEGKKVGTVSPMMNLRISK
jgi:hypothetical protein